MKAIILVFLTISLTFHLSQSQHIQQFQSGTVTLTPLSFQSSNTNRNFTIQANPLLIMNGSLVYSFLSFNYFVDEVWCQLMQRKVSGIIVECSPNVYKLSFLLVEKGPNIFIEWSERVYDKRESSFDVVDVSQWVKRLKFPLSSLVKDNATPNQLSSQYQIKLQTFISGISTFPQSQNITSTSIFSGVKLTPIYWNITLDDGSKLLAPMAVNVTSSLKVHKISFSSLIIIKEMISLNLNFQTYTLSESSGQISLGYFAATSEISFYLPNSTLQAYQSLGFSTVYNSTAPYITQGATQQFISQKITNFTKSSGVKIRLTILQQFSYLRCSASNLKRYQQLPYPRQGRYYKLVPLYNSSLVMDVRMNGSIVLSEWNNSVSQIVYFHYLGQNKYRIFNSLTKTPLRGNSTVSEVALVYSWSANESQNIWTLNYQSSNNSTNPWYTTFNLQGTTSYMGVNSSSIQVNAQVIQKSINSNIFIDTRWVIQEVDNNVTTQTINYPSISTSTSSSSNVTTEYFSSYQTFVNDSYSVSPTPYSYYSMHDGQCYLRELVDSLVSSTFTPYFIDLQNSLSSLIVNQNFSLINTTSYDFNTGYFYGICVQKAKLKNFYISLTQGWASYNVNEIQQLIIQYNTTSNDTNDKVNTQSTLQLIQLPIGCQSVKPSANNSYQCDECLTGYVLYQSSNSSEFNSSSQQQPPIKYPKKCQCQIGYYRNSSGFCKSCSSHQHKCRPPIKSTAFLTSNSESSTGATTSSERSFYIEVQIQNQQQISYQYLTPPQIILKKIVVFVNGVMHQIDRNSIRDCKNDSKDFCIGFSLTNIPKAKQYRITIGAASKINDDPLNVYLLVNQTQTQTTTPTQTHNTQQSPAYSSYPLTPKVSSTNNTITPPTVYFFRFQTFQTFVNQPISPQSLIQSISPAISTLNSSSSILLLAAPFLLDKLNFFSLLQTNSILYMMSFLKFQAQSGKQNLIQLIVKRIFIFRSEPLLKIFSLKSNNGQQQEGLIQVPFYSSQFEHNFLHNSTIYGHLSYPQTLYTQTIPSLKNASQNYFTLTLNSLANIILQILLLQTFIAVLICLFSTVKETNPQGKQIVLKKLIHLDIKRHKFIGGLDGTEMEQNLDTQQEEGHKQNLNTTEKDSLLTEKRIEWMIEPKPKQCMKLTQQSPKAADQHPISQQSQEKQPNSITTMKQRILFTACTLKQKRLIFYSSFVMIQLISQSYLLYFEIIKPFTPPGNNFLSIILSYLDMSLSMTIMFIIIIFPVFLINYYPLHLFKIVQVTCKHGAYRFGKQSQSQERIEQWNISRFNQKSAFFQHSYTYGEIFFYFCIIYYEFVLIPFSVALGPTIFYQSLPILVYQLFKLVWMYKKLKILDKLKIVTMAVIFAASSSWGFFPIDGFAQKILSDTIIWGIYIVLTLQVGKLVKFVVVFIIGLLKTEVQEQNKDKLAKELQRVYEVQKQPLKREKLVTFESQIHLNSKTNIIKRQKPSTNELLITDLELENLPSPVSFPQYSKEKQIFRTEKQINTQKLQYPTTTRKIQISEKIKHPPTQLKQQDQMKEHNQTNIGQQKSKRRHYYNKTNFIKKIEPKDKSNQVENLSATSFIFVKKIEKSLK